MTSYRNPILPGFNPDPTIIRINDDYFLSTSSFEYFPGLPIYHSKDLINWRLIGHALNRPSQLDLRTCESSCGIFAPTLRRWNGRYYMTVCAMQRKGGEGPGMQFVPPRGFYVYTDNIWDSSSWSDPIYYDVLGIDQDLFHDERTNKTYLCYATYADDSEYDRPKGMVPISSFICEIDLTTGRQKTPSKLLRYSKAGTGVCEGPHLFRKGEYVYLSTAEGGTELGHQQWICRTRDEDLYNAKWEIGPEPAINPMIFNNDHPEVQQTGHMDIVEGSDGRWWAVFLGVRPVYENKERLGSPLGRETFLAPLEWNSEGWPIVNKKQPISIEGLPGTNLARMPTNFEIQLPMEPGRDIYSDGWYHLRTPLKLEYDLDSHPGSLTLHGGPYEIEVDECPTMLLQKQPDFQCTWSFTLDFQGTGLYACAGTAVWWSRYAYASMFVRVSKIPDSDGNTAREIVFRRPDLDSDKFEEEVSFYPGEGPVRMTVKTEANKYSFYISSSTTTSANSEPSLIGSITSRSLVRSRKFDGQNTGTHLGLFAHGGHGDSALGPAIFSDIKLSGVRA